MARSIVSGFAGIIGVIMLLFLSAAVIFPALGKATGQDVSGYIILIEIVGIVLIAGAAFALFSGNGGNYGRGF
ncbi:MAG: hypothetical protein GYA23_00815 [Methanomicrobiales archaeon]|nr:hypothetical protein [Methanomicrobiales archaeon]